MKKYIQITVILSSFFLFLTCTENISYSGKIFDYDKDVYKNLTSKKKIIDYLGKPNFIDPIEKKYFYYTEKIITKNFFKNNISERKLLVFHFNNNDSIISINEFNLEDQNQTEIISEQTSNEIIKQGLLEKVFGGVGSAPVSP